MGPDTSARGSCSATLNGELFIFGGDGVGYGGTGDGERAFKQVIN